MTNEQAARTLEEQLKKSLEKQAKQSETTSAYMKAIHLLKDAAPDSRISCERAAELLEEEKNAFLDEYVDYGCVADSYILVIGMLRERAKSVSEDSGEDPRRFCALRDSENGNCLCIGGFCTAVNDEICAGLHQAYSAGKRDMYLSIRDGV